MNDLLEFSSIAFSCQKSVFLWFRDLRIFFFGKFEISLIVHEWLTMEENNSLEYYKCFNCAKYTFPLFLLHRLTFDYSIPKPWIIMKASLLLPSLSNLLYCIPVVVIGTLAKKIKLRKYSFANKKCERFIRKNWTIYFWRLPFSLRKLFFNVKINLVVFYFIFSQEIEDL